LSNVIPGDAAHQDLARKLLTLGGGGLGLAGGLYGGYQAGGAAADALLGKDEDDQAKQKSKKAAFEKVAIPVWGGRNYSLAPRGAGIGLNAGYDYLGGVVPNPYVGVDIGTPHTGMMLSGPVPGIGFRSGMFTRPPGATSSHNKHHVYGHRSLWQYLTDSRDPKDVEDDVLNDRLQSMQNVTKDEFHEAIPDYHEGPKGKPLSKELHKALTEYYHRNSRPEKQAAGNDSWKGVDLAKNPINWSRILPKADATSKNWAGSKAKPAAPTTPAQPPLVPVSQKQSAFSFGQKIAENYIDAAVTDIGDIGPGAGNPPPARFAPIQEQPPEIQRDMQRKDFRAPMPLTYRPEAWQQPANPQSKPNVKMPAAPATNWKPPLSTPQIPKAAAFGQKIAAIDWSGIGRTAGQGAALGVGMGGLAGLIAPGEEDDYDDNGNVVGKKKRNRFAAMLRGALGGGAIGGLGGAAAQGFAPRLTNAVKSFPGLVSTAVDPVNRHEVTKNLPPEMRIPANVRLMHNVPRHGVENAQMANRIINDRYSQLPRQTVGDLMDSATKNIPAAGGYDLTGERFENAIQQSLPYGATGGQIGPALR
jgi:hypothetical protein